jgi:four helix bundle protein
LAVGKNGGAIAAGCKDLVAYQKAFQLVLDIFSTTKSFPAEERYSLTDQIRRSSRSICSAIAEAYRKRKYRPYFKNKMSDADSENSETQVWLDFAIAHHYISKEKHTDLIQKSEEIGKMLNHMIEYPEKFQTKT